jgi:hypothetical protein
MTRKSPRTRLPLDIGSNQPLSLVGYRLHSLNPLKVNESSIPIHKNNTSAVHGYGLNVAK